jgi:minor extracellular serine protease Vpr
MKRAISALFLLVFAGFGQSRGGMVDYALLLEDAPVARMAQGRSALQSATARAQMSRIRGAQSSLLAELRSRKVAVGGASQVLVNAIFVRATPQTAARLLHLPGVVHVVRVPRLHRDLNTALGLINVPQAWSAITGGVANAGGGIKIGIIDSGIDQNHPGFQDSTLTPPTGFPKGDTTYTNKKVIVARSYVALDSYTPDPPNPDPVYSTPDDTTPRDRVGHGTAIAMIAAGVQNTGPQATIQGVAPKAFLGNYKIFGSPGVNDYAAYAAFDQALQDALTDGMDIVTLSLGEGDMPNSGPLDVDPACSADGITPLPCDIYAYAVESAVSAGLVVVAAAGNDGNIGVLQPPHTLSTIHTPGTAPSAITVGATVNAHLLYQAVHLNGPGLPSNLQNLQALYGDGPHLTPPAAPVIDVALHGNNGLACTSLSAGSLAGAIALIERGQCVFADKINYAQQAGAVGVILYQSVGINTIYNTLGAQNTGIPAVMIGYTDGVNLKNFIDNNLGVTAQFDQAFTPVNTQSNTIWPASSRGPSLGSFANSSDQTFAVKPELVAPGAGIYTATQTLDPNGEVYNSTGYTGVTGTSYAVPMVAGAVALVKQLHPTWNPAQLKSAVVNTAAQGVTDTDGVTTAGVDAAGAGLLNAAGAMNVPATISPATIAFGDIAAAAAPITLNVTNVTGVSASFSFAVQPLNAAGPSVTVSPSTLTLGTATTNQTGIVSVRLPATVPAAGSYEGFIAVTLANAPGGTPTLRVPYQFLVGSGVPTDIFPIAGGEFIGFPGDIGWPITLRLMDQYGVPVFGPAQFSIVSGGGSFTTESFQNPETDTHHTYGIANAFVNLGQQLGLQVFTGTAATLPAVEFDGYARPAPAIASNGVMDAASFHTDYGLAPGSYITIKGTYLSDTTQVYSTPYLPVSLSTVSVSFDGPGLSLPGHLHFVSPGQINVQVPWEFQGQSSAAMKVTVEGNTTDLQGNLYTVPLASYAPAFFLNSGTVADALDNNTAALITTANPATAGEILQLYANGLGPVTNQPASGDPAPASPLSLTTSPVTVTIGNQSAKVYGGTAFLAPGLIGLYQIDIQVPSGLSSGPQPIVISVGGQTSPAAANGSTIYLPIK